MGIYQDLVRQFFYYLYTYSLVSSGTTKLYTNCIWDNFTYCVITKLYNFTCKVVTISCKVVKNAKKLVINRARKLLILNELVIIVINFNIITLFFQKCVKFVKFSIHVKFYEKL